MRRRVQQQRQPRLVFLHRDGGLVAGGLHALQVGEQHALSVGALDHMRDGKRIFMPEDIRAVGLRLRQQARHGR